MKVFRSFIFSLFISSIICSTQVFALSLKTAPLQYSDRGTVLEGQVVFDESQKEKRPVVIVFHDWMGPSAVTMDAAKKVVENGYVAFIADVYGKGVRPKDVKEAGEQSGIYKGDRALMRARAQAALEAVKNISQADTSKVGAIGFCFGGTVALELARAGAPVLGSVSFHGGLETPDIALAKNIKGKILALHGADDPFVPVKDVEAFEREMTEAKADWQLIKFGGAVHAFTNKTVDELHLPGAAYNKEADLRSFQYMKNFFGEVFE